MKLNPIERFCFWYLLHHGHSVAEMSMNGKRTVVVKVQVKGTE